MAQEIARLISDSRGQVGKGSALVARTGEQLDSILKCVSDAQMLMTEIATTSQQQSNGLEEINSGVAQLDQVSQQNAAVAEETSAAGVSLRQKAEVLVGVLGRFRIGRQQAAPVSKVITPAPAMASEERAVISAPMARAVGADTWADF